MGKQLDLPTEAQWEYVARNRGKRVEHATNSGKIEGSYTEKRNYLVTEMKVGSYPPNPLGLYDMSGGALNGCMIGREALTANQKAILTCLNEYAKIYTEKMKF